MARAFTRQRIFVIDDDEEIAGMLGEMLSGMGYFSVVCTKPLNALTLFSRVPGRFDAVIVDEMMPDLRGTQLAVQFLRVKASIPIILMTGRGDMISMEQARESGVRTILIKPVLMERLRVVLAGLLKKARQGLKDGTMPAH
jgi:DNA-binding response OmpR family regulator